MRRLYGASPLHLLAHTAAFAIAAYALFEIVAAGFAENFALWFLGAVLLHDLVFLPLYSVCDALAGHAHRRLASRRSALNYLRVPALLSGILLCVYFPLILGLSDENYVRASGHREIGYLRNWLFVSAALFLISTLVYALRLRIDGLKDPVGPPGD